MIEKINIGIAGSCGRGRSFKTACDASGILKIHAVCDVNEEKLEESRVALGAEEKYLDYYEMIEKSDIQAVIIGTPMPFHASQAIAALNKNIHVLSEVPAAVSIEECKELVLAARRSKALYMMAENYTYIKSNVMVKEMVKRGMFGELYYAEGEYIHELKQLNEITKWRRKWQTGINGITYGTHSLGPVLQWMHPDRVISVCCAGSGHHYKDSEGRYYENEDTCVMLCKMASGALVKIRVDMLSDRPHAMTNYQLQGTDGCYESARAHGERHRIWIRSLCPEMKWMYLDELGEQFLPQEWKKHQEIAMKTGHGGGDFFEIMDFCDAITGKKKCPIGIDEAMDMTLPGLVSQQSIVQNGKWLDVPDSRQWN
ncbi:MAG: Gfo/Idh/MocA family oxidoreductase [Candidatus Omnitrophica bacterium]|nr:Gfo/Idh/MocA family oxidoreductase [Candidatus Omnitrophota bacterium]MCM8824590.1 Gfo/Idh/MocA family oxidoreductase [Candidatus Omnitrophota bacterium]